MSTVVFLSYSIGELVPGYGSKSLRVGLRRLKSFDSGDAATTSEFVMENHIGTHVDCPAHFFREGASVAEYEPAAWCFQNVQVLDVEVMPGQLVGDADLAAEVEEGTDLLLLRSGWSDRRGSDTYSCRNPGLAPDFCRRLRRERRGLRMVGMDWVSVSSYLHRDEGREAHRALLDPEGAGEAIRILEDMYLPPEALTFREVWVAPLRIENLDSAPCTVLAVLD